MKYANTLLAVATIGFSATTASALTTFVTDPANSSDELTDQSGGGLTCWITDCSLDATLASSFASTSFDLEVGDSQTFDFITFSGDGTTGFSDRDFSISATLAFDPPGASGSSTGNGGGFLFLGYITGGSLYWDEAMPMTITAANGSVFELSFDQGDGILLEGNPDYTLSATVTLLSEVPLPAGGLLLGTALAGFGIVGARRRRK
ncbi:VPLPA-CTERM sorting domain-containing protein [Tropicimonas sp.]|uniref:VPLPA-CTERM sorting domain-containing protein n=1 Tax=Tropicimonas sp. TaxID=2067044 RepID=UPI003A85647F